MKSKDNKLTKKSKDIWEYGSKRFKLPFTRYTISLHKSMWNLRFGQTKSWGVSIDIS